MIALDNGFSVFTKIYMPWYMPEVQYALQDMVALNGSFYLNCDVNKFFTVMTALISFEGLSEMGSRAAGSYFFEFATLKEVWADPQASSFAFGTALGGLFGNITNYHI